MRVPPRPRLHAQGAARYQGSLDSDEPPMPAPTATDVRIFVPALDLAVSKAFYVALGWQFNWEEGNLVELELAGHRFLLQGYYERAWAENFMIHVSVDDAEAWHAHAATVVPQFPNTNVAPPKRQDYGAVVTHVWDPCGVLLHFAQFDKT